MSSHVSRQMAHLAVAPNSSSTPKSLPSEADPLRFPKTSVLAWCSQLQLGHLRVALPCRLGDVRVIMCWCCDRGGGQQLMRIVRYDWILYALRRNRKENIIGDEARRCKK